MKKVLKYLDRHFEEYVLIILTTVLVATLFLQVVMRNVTGITFSWTEELARYVFIWSVFIGVSYAVKKNKHIKIDSLGLLFRRNGKFIISTFSNLVFLVFAIMAVYYGSTTVFEISRMTPGLGISYGWVYASTLIGFSLTLIRLIQSQWNMIIRWRNNEEVDV
ncbi:TRAP transporter small permease [Gracilibacillus oryzae]|uniref:TRAP transporter small permease n=1 Tax=Gracilibacillus oryzae TaxID=1672701 RepID=A0A7C8GST5_9BACI|nr:TRAP transporter small permease [Gracilibacillus oryzae]KAB8132661.1 TRAP transporter small permease [Gracilibacillus oryzae]